MKVDSLLEIFFLLFHLIRRVSNVDMLYLGLSVEAEGSK